MNPNTRIRTSLFAGPTPLALLLALFIAAIPALAATPKFVNIGKKLTFSIDETAQSARFAIPGTSMEAPENAVFWRMILDDGLHTEIAAFSNGQSGKASVKGGVLHIRYDSIKAQNGTTYAVALNIEVKEEDGMLSFRSTIENKDNRVRVNELQSPIFEAAELCGPRAKDILYMPKGMGRRTSNPWDKLKAHETGYLTNDDQEYNYAVTYPGGSMAWMGIETGPNFIYMGRHDEKIRNCVLIARRQGLGMPEKLGLAVAHLPAARAGETLALPPVLVGALPGDWRAGAAAYRAWAQKSFYKPVKKNSWVMEMNGWQRIILRSQYGEDYYTFEDLPKLYEIGKKHGIDTLFLFGWWTEGMDIGYPDYNITPEAKRSLKDNIDKVQKMGGHVILVCNANFVDTQTEYFKKHGDAITRMDMYGNLCRKDNRFSGYSVLRRLFGARQFAQVCYGSTEWQNQLIRQVDMLKEYAPHCIFYDCFGLLPHMPCFNDTHSHGPRIDEDWVGRRKVFEQLVELTGKDVLGTEQVSDIAGAYAQFIHSSDVDHWADKSSFPQMFRQAFPEIILSNRRARDESGAYDRSLKVAFMLGLRFDVEIYRCRGNLDNVPSYAKLIGQLNKKREEYKDFMVYGKFELTSKNRFSPGFHCTEYTSSDGTKRLRILYNGSTAPIKYGKLTLKPDEMRFDIFNK